MGSIAGEFAILVLVAGAGIVLFNLVIVGLQAGSGFISREVFMDIAFSILTVLFFAVTAALVYGCERLRGRS